MGEAVTVWFFLIFCGILAWIWAAGKNVEQQGMLPLQDEEGSVHGGQ